MIQVAVVGATGYAGAELVRILTGHPQAKLTALTSRQYAGTPFAAIYPAMASVTDLKIEPYDIQSLHGRCDVAFLALPHKVPMAIAPELIAAGIKVVDLSADFRFASAARYAACYEPHGAPELLEKSVYGLTEIYREAIAEAQLIGNPGCYPTCVLLPLIPLLRDGLVDPSTLIADAKSGVSGAGRSPSLSTHFCEVVESYKPYKVAQHRHNPEMDEVLSREAGQSVHITFVPHLVPMSRGMLATIYARPRPGVELATIGASLARSYRQAPFIRLYTEGQIPDTRNVRGTNFVDIGLRIDPHSGLLILISALDNLVKGAAGQAVQNMNLMFGLNETAGLNVVPYPL